MADTVSAAKPRASSTSPRGSSARRRRGRPTAAEAQDVREKLLQAARELFPRYGYRAVSSRQIATHAGVNFAMIRYYFGGKPGLYREMLLGVFMPAQAALDTLDGDAGCVPLEVVLANMIRTWAANPWIAGFVVREVLAPGAPMRAMFLREFPERLAPLLERIVEREKRAGRVRPQLEPRLLALSLVSLAIFPFLGLPLTSRVFGVGGEPQFLERFVRHTQDLLLRGVDPRADVADDPALGGRRGD